MLAVFRKFRTRYLQFIYSSRLLCVAMFVANATMFNLIGGIFFSESWLELHSLVSLAGGSFIAGLVCYEGYKKGHIKIPQ